MKAKKGNKAPAIELVNTELETVQIPPKGTPTVLLFFPLAFTSVCTTELCSVRDDLKLYDEMDAQVYAISVDSPFTLKEFKESQKLNFPLLSDFNKSAARAYGTLYEEFVFGMQGVAKRSAFVIDGEGEIKYAEILDDAGDLPNFEKIQSTLENL